jgi:hypothetical protein
MRIRSITAAAAVAALSTVGFAGTALADEHAGMANENARECSLKQGGDFTAPGFMIQYLADREEGFAGTPKAVVDYYGNWDNVGALIAQKCA